MMVMTSTVSSTRARMPEPENIGNWAICWPTPTEPGMVRPKVKPMQGPSSDTAVAVMPS